MEAKTSCPGTSDVSKMAIRPLYSCALVLVSRLSFVFSFAILAISQTTPLVPVPRVVLEEQGGKLLLPCSRDTPSEVGKGSPFGRTEGIVGPL